MKSISVGLLGFLCMQVTVMCEREWRQGYIGKMHKRVRKWYDGGI